MNKLNTEEEIKQIASQLKCPSGDQGLEIADLMHQTNIDMTMSGVVALALQPEDALLEIGHGSCGHLDAIFRKGREITYYGLETSVLMKESAEHTYAAKVVKEQAHFFHYEGGVFPFQADFFDALMTVNTIYFWNDPALIIKELYRVLRPGGRCSIVFAEKEFMNKLPFVQYDFELYGEKEFRNLVAKSLLKLKDILTKKDIVKNKLGDLVERTYLVAVLTK